MMTRIVVAFLTSLIAVNTLTAADPNDSNTTVGPRFEIVGIELVKKSKGIKNWNAAHREYSLHVHGILPDAPEHIQTNLVTAVTDNNQSLLPEKNFGTNYFPPMGEKFDDFVFEVEMKRPPKNARYLKEVSGFIEYDSCSDVNIYRFDISALYDANKPQKFGATVKTWNAAKDIHLKLNVQSAAIKSIKFFNEQGKELKDEGRWSQSSNDPPYFTETSFSFESGAPKAGRIEIEIYGKVEHKKVPYKFTDITFLGDKVRNVQRVRS